jgi:amino acid transporter
MLAILIAPFVWAVPISFLVGEMAAADPAAGGYYEWIKKSNGKFMGALAAWSSLAMSFFDMAIYPSLFITYLYKIVPAVGTDVSILSPAWSVGAIVIVICAALCMFGIKFVGRSSALIMLLLLMPFVIMVYNAIGMPTVDAPLNTETTKEIAILMCLWNYLGWDNASTLAPEVADPQKTYPRGIFLAVLITTLCYAASIFVASKYHTTSMVIGSWVDVAGAIGNRFLKNWTAIGGMLCGVWMFSALVTSYSQIPLALAKDKILPAIFCSVNRFGVPYFSVITACVIYALSMSIGLKRLIEIDVILYGVVFVLQAVSLITTRLKRKMTPEHFIIPGGVFGLVYTVCTPITVLGAAIWYARNEIGMWSISSYKLGLCVIAICAFSAMMSVTSKNSI